MDAVVDLETLSLDHDATVLTIGITAFDIEQQNSTEELEAQTIYMVADAEAQIKAGSKAEAGTIKWWLDQEYLARKAVMAVHERMGATIGKIGRFFSDYNIDKLWGNGCDFDNVVLIRMFKRLEHAWPLHYRAAQDLPTLKRVAKRLGWESPKFLGTQHHAADDAINEAIVIQSAWAHIHNLAG